VPFLLATELLSFFVEALLFDFMGVPSFGIFGVSGINIHRDCIIISGALESLLGHPLPFALVGTNKGVVSSAKSFSENAQLAYFTSCEFFPFIQAFRPDVTLHDGDVYSPFESIFEFLQDPYFVMRDFCLSDQVFELGNIIINFVTFHFEAVEFISGLFHLPSVGEGEFE